MTSEYPSTNFCDGVDDVVKSILGPKPSDKPYISKLPLRIAILLRLDSYKFAHPYAYPDEVDGYEPIDAMSSYGEARCQGETIVPFNMQQLLSRYFQDPITIDDINFAEAFSIKHFGRKLFRREVWESIVAKFGGLLPITIRSLPEGTKVKSGLPIYNVTAFGRMYAFLSSGVETILQRGIWYGTTIASMDYAIKADLTRIYEGAGANMGLLPFALHDFGARGVTCGEQAEIGGAAHLVSFMGSDTVEGILTANHYYNEEMAGFSVYATEHSVQCSFGKGAEDQVKYIAHQIRQAKNLGLPVVSIVLDGFDVIRESEACCTNPVLRDAIIEFGKAGGKVVFRPDSGDMMTIVPRILRLQEVAFGSTVTSKGYRSINYVGVIQGDGVDHLAIKALLGKIMVLGFSPDCVIFGSGGALLQKVNRDTFKFAQKASAILRNGVWEGTAKDPITDPGKKSKEGVMTTVRSRMTGEMMAARLDQGPLDADWEDMFQLNYHNGQLYNETSMRDIRARVAA